MLNFTNSINNSSEVPNNIPTSIDLYRDYLEIPTSPVKWSGLLDISIVNNLSSNKNNITV